MKPHTVTPSQKVTLNQICAYAKNKDICLGDSGGPLATYDATYNYWTLIGVSSLSGIGGNLPGTYARVTAQLEWINFHNTGRLCQRPDP